MVAVHGCADGGPSVALPTSRERGGGGGRTGGASPVRTSDGHGILPCLLPIRRLQVGRAGGGVEPSWKLHEPHAEPFPLFLFPLSRLSLLSICLHTFLAYVRLYTPLPSFPELFAPSLPTLKSLSEVALPEGVERCREEVWGAISAGVRDSEALRQPLRMRAKQAVARKQFNPIFEEK